MKTNEHLASIDKRLEMIESHLNMIVQTINLLFLPTVIADERVDMPADANPYQVYPSTCGGKNETD